MSISQTKIWLLAIRPKTLFAVLAPVLIGTAMAVSAKTETGNSSFHLTSFLATLFGGLMIQIGTNLANDYYDFKKGADSGKRLGPMRVTQQGLVTQSQIKSAFIIAFSLAFLAGIYLVFRGGVPIVVIGLFSILFGVLYTGGPFPLAYNGLGDIFVLIFFGPVAVGGTYYLQTFEISNFVLIASLAPGFLSTAILAVNNLRDIKSDKLANKKTLAVRLGSNFTQYQYLFLILGAGNIPLFLYYYFDSTPNILVATVIIPLSFPQVLKVFKHPASSELNLVLERTGQILFLYALLFSIGLMI